MVSIRFRYIGLAAFIAVLFLMAPLSSAAAQVEEPEERQLEERQQEESLQEERQNEMTIVAGPHQVRVVLANNDLSAGFVKLVLFVTDANTGAAVPDARVVIRASNEAQDYEGWATALNSPGMPERYDVRMKLGSTGEWVINVDVSSSLGQGGAPSLTLDIPSFKRNTAGSMVFFVATAVLVLGVAYIVWSTKRTNRRREAPQGEPQG